MDTHRRCRPFYTSSGAHQRYGRASRLHQVLPVPSSYSSYSSSQPQFLALKQTARLKSHPLAPFANPHQPSPNVNDSAPRPLFLSAANVNDHRAATHQPLVAARKVLWTSKTLPGDHFSRYGHCQRPRCLLCSSSPTQHCLPGTSVPPPEPCPFPVVPTQAPRASAQRQRLPRRDQEPAAPTPQCLPGMSVPPPGALPLSRGAHSGAAGQRKTSTTTARLSGATIPSRR